MKRLLALAVALAAAGGACRGGTSPVREDAAIQRWVQLLGSRDPGDRADAGDALVKIGARAVPALIQTLSDPDEDTRSAAMWALGRMGPAAEPALPALQARWQHGVARERAYAEEQIRHIESKNPERIQEAIDQLAVKTDQADNEGRMRLERTLVEAGALAAPKLLKALKESNSPDVQNGVIQVLMNLGKYADPAIPTLRGMMWDRELGYNAVQALLFLKVDIVPELILGLDDRQAHVRNMAIIGLCSMKPPSAAALPGLTRALADPDIVARGNAVQALRQMGPSARSAVPQLLKSLTTTNDKGSILRALATISPSDPAVQAAIRTGIHERGDGGRSSTYQRIGALSAASESGQLAIYARDLSAASRDKDPEVRKLAERFLYEHPEIKP